MKIGIIGAGQIGGTLTRRLTQLGHEVFVSNSRGPSSLAGLANGTGAKAVTVREAAGAGQMVIVTIPEANIRDLPKALFEGVPPDVVVIDTGNYYPRERDGRINEIEAGMTESRVRDGSPCRSRATTPGQSKWCCGWLTNSDLTEWTPEP